VSEANRRPESRVPSPAPDRAGDVCRLGVDIGGTFTDFVLLDEASGALSIWKTLTTADDPSRGVEAGVGDLLELAGVPAGRVADVVHGTTVVTNALIERKGAPTALVSTRGFRDVLHIGRELRYDMYDILLDLPKPLVERRHSFEIAERTLADGTLLEPLDLSAVDDLIAAIRAEGIRGVAICFLHSYRNPTNERALAAALRERAPELAVSLSSEVAPAIREYTRASTTVANVYVQPLVRPYVEGLERRLAAMGCPASLFIMLSNGGIATAENAARFPVRMIESGPAAGVLAASFYGDLVDVADLVAFDMGGTTAKVTLVRGAQPTVAGEFEVARMYRLKKGSGLPITVPSIEMIEIGAGGGSIARIDELGLLKVGPDSAGSAPGPACYALGGAEPTVTDADLALGYLDPSYFLGGRMHLDPGAAEAAIRRVVSEPLGLSPAEAAWGIHQVVNEQMASAVRVHAIERGVDLRRFGLFAFGGAGPVHACRVAEILGLPLVLCPQRASVLSAFGLLTAPVAFDFVRTQNEPMDRLDWERVDAFFAEMEAEGRDILRASGVAEEKVTVRATCDMRYAGQAHELNVALPAGQLGAESVAAITGAFEEAYRRLYSLTLERLPLEIINWRLVVSAERPRVALAPIRDANGHRQALKGHRWAYFPEVDGYRETPVYDRYQFHAGFRLAGPALVEENETTTVIPPGWAAEVDRHGTLIIRAGDGAKRDR
jgi:N-methylhydantoinase A